MNFCVASHLKVRTNISYRKTLINNQLQCQQTRIDLKPALKQVDKIDTTRLFLQFNIAQ